MKLDERVITLKLDKLFLDENVERKLCRFLERDGKVVFILFSSDHSSGKHANVWKEIPKQQPSCYLQPAANKTDIK